jgi:hypothetical protein
MRHSFSVVLVAAVGIAGAAASLQAAETSIVVRTYTEATSAGEIRTARRAASAILERAGVQVVWLECGLPDRAADAEACTRVPRWNELLIRIVSAGVVDGRFGVDTLGSALVDVDAGTGSLATVYADRVRVMAQSAGIDEAELLGRAMAHEIGHLLLGTNGHASQGLMRASWSSVDLRGHRVQWFFNGKEGEAMRRGIAGRLRFQPHDD